ncbi:hypothetical protein J7F03_40540 [Streptomyces sp. ISL-43]|uniref:hypothetical protein n=1 Tax=Streptomyces sp. ISL-43 TaxID=2819183 RepID=UPI001BED2171|nr:hypothetical protein [Streptomyces sp. ISL-43]MBT2453194.1 hypothetical protein [Streptomyces sp. ISL-43]
MIKRAEVRTAAMKAVLDTVTRPVVINLVGPVGCGKSAILAELATAVPVVDDVRSEDDVARLALPADGPVVVASRRPLPSYRAWRPGAQVITVEAGPWPDEEISLLVDGFEFPQPHLREGVLRLAGGNALLASALCRALHAAPDGGPGVLDAAADAAAREVCERLGGEAAGIERALLLVAAVGQCDVELLGQLGEDGTVFDRLRACSVVVPGALGLAVAEPFRTVFDQALRWRTPVAYRSARTLAAAHHTRLLPAEHSGATRSNRMAGALYASLDGPVRRLFSPVTAPVHVRPARADDASDVGRLVRLWAERGGMDVRRSERLLGSLLHGVLDGLHVVCDREDRPVGLSATAPICDATMPVLEPLLQQHADAVSGGGLFIGLAMYEDRQEAARSALFRHLLSTAVDRGRLVTSTPSVEYQALYEHVGVRAHGQLRHDVYGGGSVCRVYSQDFAAAGGVPPWLERLRTRAPAPVLPDDAAWFNRHIRQALEGLHRPQQLARSPLLPVAGDPAALRELLESGVRHLVESAVATEAEAGRILSQYYVERGGGHDFIAIRLHMSRATYFRRLNQGLTLLASAVLARCRQTGC